MRHKLNKIIYIYILDFIRFMPHATFLAHQTCFLLKSHGKLSAGQQTAPFCGRLKVIAMKNHREIRWNQSHECSGAAYVCCKFNWQEAINAELNSYKIFHNSKRTSILDNTCRHSITYAFLIPSSQKLRCVVLEAPIKNVTCLLRGSCSYRS